MKKFKFRLEQVLGFRLSLKDERKRELLAANLRLKEAEDLRDALSQELLRNGLSDGEILSVAELTLRGAYRERTKLDFERSLEAIAAREAEVQQALEAYIAAAKDANALETLKKRRFQEYTERIQKEEERVLDEGATQRAGRALIERTKAKRTEAHGQVRNEITE